MVGKKVVVLGSGDVGLIMARRLTLEGAKVECVVEILPYASGLPRNVVQCLHDYGIPLLLGHTVTEVRGKKRVESVVTAEVDGKFRPIKETEREIDCDTLLLSVGLIPENELSRKAGILIDDATGGPQVNELLETSLSGVFACGNVLHVHDVADYASIEASEAGRNAALYAKGLCRENRRVPVFPGENVRHVVPHRADPAKDLILSLRVCSPRENVSIAVTSGGRILKKQFMLKANPSEMITLKVRSSELKGAGELRVEVTG